MVEEDSDTTDPAFELPQGLNENHRAQFQTDEDPTSFGRQMISRKSKEEIKPSGDQSKAEIKLTKIGVSYDSY